MTTYTADTPREWREKGGSLAKKLYTEFGLLQTLVAGIDTEAESMTLTKATITLTAATKLNLGSPVIDITSGIVEMGSQGSGIALTTDYPFGFDLHVKPTADITPGLTGRTCGIRMRYEVGGDQTTQISHAAVLGHLRITKDMGDGVHAGIDGYIEADGGAATVISGTSTTQTCAGHFAVELGTGVEVSTGWLTGVTVDSSVHSSAVISAAEFAGLRVKKTGTAKDWEYGLHIRNSTTGIDIGACTTGIALTGTFTNAIKVGASGTGIVYTQEEGAINSAIYSNYIGITGFFRGLYVESVYTPSTAESGEASVYGIRGKAELASDCTNLESSSERMIGVDGAFENKGTVNGAGLWVAGTRGALFGAGTWTEVKFVSAVLAACQITSPVDTGIYSAFAAYSTSTVPDTVMNVHGSFVTFADLTNATEGTGYVYDKVSAASDTIIGNLVIRDTDGNLGYINVYSDQGDAGA